MELYIQILSTIKTAIIDDDVDSCKVSCGLLNYIIKNLPSESVQKFQENACANLTEGNLICLACKWSARKVLAHLLLNENNVCSLTHLTEKSNLLPEEEDGDCHNAVYYAIRSNEIEIIEILLEKWLRNCFKEHTDGLDELLSAAFRDLKIRNVPISEDMEKYVKSNLINLRFYNNETPSAKKNTANLRDTQNLKDLTMLRIDFVLEKITYLREEFWISEPNEKFLVASKYIAKNIHMLKSCTNCNRLPWEQIEFCLIIFIRSCQTCFQKYPLYHFIMRKRKLLEHLETFSHILIQFKDKVGLANKSKNGKLWIDEMKEIENMSGITELYHDFTQIRDLYSLEKMKSSIDIAVTADVTETCDQLVIVRALQVIGECMKNSVDSPNLSSPTYESLLSSFPTNMKEVVVRLRDKLSHSESLTMRSEIELSGQNFFKSIQSDINQMNVVVSDIVLRKKSVIIASLLSKLISCKEYHKMRLFFKETCITWASLQKELEEALNLNVKPIIQLETLFLELERGIQKKLNDKGKLILRFEDIFQNVCNMKKPMNGDGIKTFFPSSSKEMLNLHEQISPLLSKSHDNEENKLFSWFLFFILELYEIKKAKSLFKKIEYWSSFPMLSIPFVAWFLSKLQIKKKGWTIHEDVMKYFEEVISKHKIDNDLKLGFLKHMLQTTHALIQDQKNSLTENQTKFCSYLNQIIPIIECDFKECSNFLEDRLKYIHKEFNNIPLSKISRPFTQLITQYLELIISDVMMDTSERGDFYTKTISPMLTFLSFYMNDIKWIKEFQQILPKPTKLKPIKSFKNVIDQNEQMKNLLTSKLTLLRKVVKNYHENKQFYEESLRLEKTSKMLSVIEMLLLDSMTILGFIPNRLAHNTFYLDQNYPLINGKNLRNHLAHGNALISVVSEDGATDIIVNSEEMIRREPHDFERQIGKKVKNDPQKLKIILERDLSAVDEQLQLFVALTEGNIEKIKDCLRNGADMLGRDLKRQTAMHFAAKGTCLKTVKLVSEFNIDASVKDVNQQTALHVASMKGTLPIVEYLIQEMKVPINCKDIHGKSPVNIASFYGNTDIVKCLLKYGARIESKDLFGRDALHYAVTQNHIGIVRFLLENEPNVESSKTRGGLSVLHLASEKGHKNLVEILLEKINVNIETDIQWIPLHYAAQGGHADVVQTLMKEGADINAKTIAHMTPLYLAAEEGHYDVVKILIQHGADKSAADEEGFTPLSCAVNRGFLDISKLLVEKDVFLNDTKNSLTNPLFGAAFFGHHELVSIMLNKSDNRTNILTLHWATMAGHLSVVELLVNNISNLKYIDTGCTALHTAAHFGHTDIVNFLIFKHYDIDAIVSENEFLKYKEFLYGKTALYLSSHAKHKDIVRSLLRNGADIYIKTEDGTTSLDAIIKNGMSHILVEERVPMKDAFCDSYSPLQLGAAVGDLSFVKYCIEEGCDINAKNRGRTALDLAVFGRVEVVNYLINCGADVNAPSSTALDAAIQLNRYDIFSKLVQNTKMCTEKERGCLLSAVRLGHEDMVEYFLSINPSLGFSRPEYREYPLHEAAQYGHINTVKKLLDFGERTDINEKNNRGKTPLEIASSKGYCEIVRFLLSNGADSNKSGTALPLHIAIENNDFELVKILLEAGASVVLLCEGRSAIELAIKSRNQDLTELILELSDIDINFKGKLGRTMLHEAAYSGSLQIVQSLIEKGILINCKDSSGSKPIHIAAEEGHQDIVEYFLNEGQVDIQDRGQYDWCLLHYAASGNQSEVCEFLINKGMDVNTVAVKACTPLHVAAFFNNADVLHFLLHHGAHYDLKNDSNETAYDFSMDSLFPRNVSVLLPLTFISHLFDAVKKNHIPIAEAILKEGMNFSKFGYANVLDASGMSLLHYASRDGHEEIANLLLKYNANPNMRTENGFTPLHHAAKFSHPKIVIALLRNEALFDAECKFNKTPLCYATDYNIVKTLDFVREIFLKIERRENFMCALIDVDEVKAVTRAKNSCGRTLITHAFLNDHPEFKKLLYEFQPDVEARCRLAIEDFKNGHLEESLQKLNSILDERIDIYGEEDQKVLEYQMFMCVILSDLERHDEAQNLAERVYRIRKEIFGDYNEGTLSSMDLISTVLFSRGRKKEARDVYAEILNKKIESLGLDRPETLETQIKMATLLFNEGTDTEISKATKLCLETLEKLKKFPEKETSVLSIRIMTANMLVRLGKPHEALEIYKKVLEVQKEIFGTDHPDTSDTLFEITNALFCMDEKEESLHMFEEVIKIQQRTLEPNHEKILKSRNWLADFYFSEQMYLDALTIYRADLELRTSILGENHSEILETRNKIGKIILQMSIWQGRV